MPQTPIFGLRWPLSTDTPDVPRDCQNLAEDTEAALRLQGRWAVGSASGTFQDGATVVSLTSISQAGGFSLSGGAIVAPADGRYLVTAWAKYNTALAQVWVGRNATEHAGLALAGGSPQVIWAGSFSWLATGTAGSPLQQVTVYGASGPYEASITQTVVWLGEPS